MEVLGNYEPFVLGTRWAHAIFFCFNIFIDTFCVGGFKDKSIHILTMRIWMYKFKKKNRQTKLINHFSVSFLAGFNVTVSLHNVQSIYLLVAKKNHSSSNVIHCSMGQTSTSMHGTDFDSFSSCADWNKMNLYVCVCACATQVHLCEWKVNAPVNRNKDKYATISPMSAFTFESLSRS